MSTYSNIYEERTNLQTQEFDFAQKNFISDLKSKDLSLPMAANKKKFLLSKMVMDIINEAGGYLFGGCVRDLILHDYHSDLFYKKNQVRTVGASVRLESIDNASSLSGNTEVLDEFSNENKQLTQQRYDNHFINSELKERFLVPTDIDCYMDDETKKIMIQTFEENCLSLLLINSAPLHIYLPDCDTQNRNLKLEKYIVKIKLPFNIRKILNIEDDTKIFLDVISHKIMKNIQAPFGSVDFECNSLIITPEKNIIVSKKLIFDGSNKPLVRLSKTQQIINDIKNKIAVAAIKAPSYRVENLMNKEWNLVGTFADLITYELSYINNKLNVESSNKSDEEEETICLICKDHFENEYCLYRSCCNKAYFHRKCFGTLLESRVKRNCPNCNDRFLVDEIEEHRSIRFT